MRPLLLTLLVLVAVSVCMTLVCMGYGGVMVGVPYQDATPAQAAAQQHHFEVSGWLGNAALLTWLVTLGAGVGLGVRWLVVRKRTRTEEKA